MRKILILVMFLFLAGCDKGSSYSQQQKGGGTGSNSPAPRSNSLKAPDQLTLEQNIIAVNQQYANIVAKYGNSSREEEGASKALGDFWSTYRNNKSNVVNWTCRMTAKWDNEAGITDKGFPNPYYQMPLGICIDTDIAQPDFKDKLNSYSLSYRIYTSKSPNLPKFYPGDVVYISGIAEIFNSGAKPYEAKIDADYVGLQPQPTK